MIVMLERCVCGLEAEAGDGPRHRYMVSTASCWEAYGHLLAREYEDQTRWRTHRLTVDAYAVQHPGVDGPQVRNSVGIHLSRLELIFGRGWPLERANAAMLTITAKKFEYPWLAPPAKEAGMTALDVLATGDAAEHIRAVELWARNVWASWAEHRATVQIWLERIR